MQGLWFKMLTIFQNRIWTLSAEVRLKLILLLHSWSGIWSKSITIFMMLFIKVLQRCDFLKYAGFTMYNPEYYNFLEGEEI